MSSLGIDYDATVAWLGRRHDGDWDRVAHSFTAFLRFAATLGGDEAAALRHVDPLSFTPNILESRAAYQNWRHGEAQRERAERRRSKRQYQTTGHTGVEEEQEDSIFGGKAKPSGFSVLKDSIADKVEDIHAKVRTMLPSIDEDGDDDDDDSDGSIPEVFFSNYDWSKIRLPGDPGWDEDSPRGVKSQPVRSPPAPTTTTGSVKKSELMAESKPEPQADVVSGRKVRQPFGVLPRGFFERPFKRPSECDTEDPIPDEEELERFERLERSLGIDRKSDGNPNMPSPFDAASALNKALSDHGVSDADLQAVAGRTTAKTIPAVPSHQPATRRWNVVDGNDDSDDEPSQPPAKPVRADPPAATAAPAQRPGRWQVIEHSDDSDDDEPSSGKGKGKGKGKGGKGMKGPCAP